MAVVCKQYDEKYFMVSIQHKSEDILMNMEEYTNKNKQGFRDSCAYDKK